MKTIHPKIGDWARLEAVAEVCAKDPDDRHNRHRVVRRTLLKEPAIGQFVGVSYLYEGRKVSGSYEESGYLADRRGVLVYLVRLGLRSKPVHVLPGDFRESYQIHTLPYTASPVFLLDQGYRKVREAIEPAPGS